jgi:hypothetical protein
MEELRLAHYQTRDDQQYIIKDPTVLDFND